MRPAFHFTAKSGWINDPHGITVTNGEYHLFYQYVPDSTVWAPNCHWGHARGTDLFSLEQLPVAIAPGEGDEGIGARVVAAHRLADRITLELHVEGQARPVELDFAATPGLTTPAPGSELRLVPLRYRVYGSSPCPKVRE